MLQVLPETQPVLPCLLRRLLQQNGFQDALNLATQHASAPHFSRSIEWLLFTALEINNDTAPSPSGGKLKATKQPDGRAAGQKPAGPLLTAVADLLRNFAQVISICLL